MILEFNSEEEFYDTLNQWVRDGSRIVSVYSFQTVSGYVYGAQLVGSDGCLEELEYTFEMGE